MTVSNVKICLSPNCDIFTPINTNYCFVIVYSWIGPRPRALSQLVRVGVPEALRGEVWLRLAGVDQNDKLMETYRTLISKVNGYHSQLFND